jgi:putative FmdB family regulatory protein
MPFYLFNCQEHGKFETYQGINEVHTEACPVCKKIVNRVFSPPVIMGDLPNINKAKSQEAESKMKATSL